ncbi:MAG: NUDIX domain-containing protein, partial [Alphaproteobacteria bacterium]|nr:NUDIX domain-containing protein [Alphaproteobacteria bacterium]
IKVGKNFDGSPGENITREVYQRGSGNVIGVLLYDPKSDNIILVEQLRAGVLSAVKGNLSNFYASEMNPCCKEIVLGMIESDELPEQAAIRESLEETGCEVLELSPIIKYFSSPGGITEYVHLYAGRVNTSVQNGEIHGNKEENEDIKVHVLPASEAIRLLYANQLNDGHTIIAIQWFATRRTDLRSKWLVKDVGTSII